MSNDSLMPWQIIKNLVHERKNWSNEQILEELRSLPVLPDEDYYEHAQEHDQYERMDKALDIYLAIVKLAENRHLTEAIPLLLERASYGDFGETMCGLNGAFLRIIGKSEKEQLYHFAVAAKSWRTSMGN